MVHFPSNQGAVVANTTNQIRYHKTLVYSDQRASKCLLVAIDETINNTIVLPK